MLSFIVPAYDEAPLIGATVDAIHAAARAVGEPYEVIVVDDASADRTGEVAEEHGARVVSVRHRQIAATRNSGACAARGDRLVFVDADTLVNEPVVRAAVAALRDGAVGGGSSVQFDRWVPPYARVLLKVLLGLFRLARWAGGCFVFCTAEAFRAAGGFDETLFASEEVALSKALKRQGRFVVLREAVTTSGRKLRAYSGWEILRTCATLALPGALKSRRKLDIWYGTRREDPETLS